MYVLCYVNCFSCIFDEFGVYTKIWYTPRSLCFFYAFSGSNLGGGVYIAVSHYNMTFGEANKFKVIENGTAELHGAVLEQRHLVQGVVLI